MAYTYALPRATAALITQENQEHLERCRHLGLMLDKMVPREVINDQEKSGERNNWLKGLATRFELRNNPQQKPNAEDSKFLDLWMARYRRWLEMLEETPGVKLFQAPLKWRMIVGLGGESVLETDLTLDHLTGLPIIPGSALKGLTRAWAAREHCNSDSTTADDDPPEVKDLFGAQDHAGNVVFFDAFPIPPGLASGKPRFDVDIMNPHYPKYYGDSAQGQNPSPPSNDQSPIPVFFLTVAGASFQFALAPRPGAVEVKDSDVEQVMGWLQSALREDGAGGKTNAGYGAFGPATDGHPSLPAPRASASSQNDEVLKYTDQEKLQGVVKERAEDGVIIVFKNEKV